MGHTEYDRPPTTMDVLSTCQHRTAAVLNLQEIGRLSPDRADSLTRHLWQPFPKKATCNRGDAYLAEASGGLRGSDADQTL
jgi:hypothetical protein